MEIRTTSSTGGQKGVKLARFDLVPQGPLIELAEHFGVGASKYDDHQWRAGYEWSKSYSAMMRHLAEFWAGRDYDVCSNDPDGCQHVDSKGQPFTAARNNACYNHTGSHHMVAVMWHSAVLLEFKDRFPQFDDRYKFSDPIEELSSSFWLESKDFDVSRLTQNFDDGSILLDGVVVCTCFAPVTSSEFSSHMGSTIHHLTAYHKLSGL